jgi:flagellar hook-associated protein 2
MSTPFASIGGIASGLDTAGIVQSLMALERRPMQLLQQRQATFRAADAAWGQINTRLSTLRTATNALRDPQALANTVKVGSSDAAVATATASGAGALPGTVSLTVTRLAAAHQVALGGSFASADQVLGAGTFTLTRDGQDHTVTLGEGATLADAARALDRLDGFQARVVRTGTDEHRLVVTSTTTGEGSRFEVTTSYGLPALPPGADEQSPGVQRLALGVDAELAMGALTITRATNTIDDLVDGVSLRLQSAGAVTVTVEQDLDAAAKKVSGLVDALNGVLSELAKQSATSQDAGARGPLSGDALVRTMTMQLRGALGQVVAQDGPFRTLADLGIELTREGRVTLNDSKLRAALTEDPAAAGRLLGRAGASTNPSVELTATGRAQAGTYQLDVARAPRIAAATGAGFSPPGDVQPKTFSITTATGETVAVEIDETVDVATAVLRINAALRAAGNTWLTAKLVTREDGDVAVTLEADRAGASRWFEVDGSGELGLDGRATGDDASATLVQVLPDGSLGDRWTLTGSGRTLTAPTGTPIAGLVLRTPLDAAGDDLSRITVANGFAGVLDQFLRTAEGSGGSIARARESAKGRVTDTQRSIDAFERRLEQREITLRRQFTALESAMARMGSQASWLASQLGAMQQ